MTLITLIRNRATVTQYKLLMAADVLYQDRMHAARSCSAPTWAIRNAPAGCYCGRFYGGHLSDAEVSALYTKAGVKASE